MDVSAQLGPREPGTVLWRCEECDHTYEHEREQCICPECDEDSVRMAPASMQQGS